MAELMILPQLPETRSRQHPARSETLNRNTPTKEQDASLTKSDQPHLPGNDRVEISVRSLQALQESSVSTEGTNRGNGRRQDMDLKSLLEEAVSSLDEQTTERIRGQVSRLSGFAIRLSGPTAPQMPVGNAGFAALSGSEIIRDYLAFIEAISEDKEALKTFLDMVERFVASGNVAPDEARGLFGYMSAGLGTEQGEQIEQTELAMSFLQELDIEIQAQIDAGNTEKVETLEHLRKEIQKFADPIILDLDQDGIELTSARNGVQFDINGDGQSEQTAFATGDDAFLALDRNGNGAIDDGRELFGDQHGSANGFEELAKYDSNYDGLIDEHDAVYDDLLLFSDTNKDGRSDASELRTLRQEGIASIALSYLKTNRLTSGGNRLAELGSFERFDGRKGTAADALLSYVA